MFAGDGASKRAIMAPLLPIARGEELFYVTAPAHAELLHRRRWDSLTATTTRFEGILG
jgi:hypothetical protein